MVRRKRVDEQVEHPDRFMRFKPSEWPGEPAEAYVLWVDEFREYWSEFATSYPAAPRPVEGRSRGVREYAPSHFVWLMNRLGEARQQVRKQC